MTDSDSSEEDLALLREAVDSELITDSMYSQSGTEVVENVKPKVYLKSLRDSKNEDDDQFSTFKVTPEFQNYVARHLERTLEQVLEKKLTDCSAKSDGEPKKKRKRCRIKLLSDSKHCLKVTDDLVDNTELVNRQNAKNAKIKIGKTSDSDDGLDKFKSAAIDPQVILAKTEVSHWANSKRKIFTYKKLSDGRLHIVEDNK